MNGKAVIITGGGGIGSAIAEKFSAEGFRVFVLSRKAQEFAGQHVPCDITIPEKVSEVFAEIAAQTQVFALVHTAISDPAVKKVADMSKDEFASSFAVDVFGGFNVFKVAAREFIKQNFGSIVALGSMYAEPGVAHAPLAGYVAAKMALRGLLRQLSEELKPAVRINMVSPGFVHAGLNADVPEQVVQFMKEKNPEGFVVTKEQVAEAVFNCVTGQESGKYIPIARGESEAL